MCKTKGCNWFRHLFGLCEHKRHAEQLKESIMQSKDEDIDALKKVNKRIGVMIETGSIDMRIGEISRISGGNGDG